MRLVSWNTAGHDVWSQLVDERVDVALLQETCEPSAADYQVCPAVGGTWRTDGWRSRRSTAVAAPTAVFELRPYPLGSFGDVATGRLVTSRPGTLAVCDVARNGEVVVTVASMYAWWRSKVDNDRFIFADAAAHSLLSDLSPLVTSRSGHRLIVAGDLNLLYGYGEAVPDPAYWGARYKTVFDRAAAMGLTYVGPRADNGRQAAPWPSELPEDSTCVPTYAPGGRAEAAMRQLDHVLVSDSLADLVQVRARNGVDEWGPSDHCRVEIDLQI